MLSKKESVLVFTNKKGGKKENNENKHKVLFVTLLYIEGEILSIKQKSKVPKRGLC